MDITIYTIYTQQQRPVLCIYFLPSFIVFGQQYKIMANVYLNEIHFIKKLKTLAH